MHWLITALAITVISITPQERTQLQTACAGIAATVDGGVATDEECLVELARMQAIDLVGKRGKRAKDQEIRNAKSASEGQLRQDWLSTLDIAVCGDAELDAGEECDPGRGNFDDITPDVGCRTSCLDPYCGDRVIDTGEACDPPGPNCTPSCVLIP